MTTESPPARKRWGAAYERKTLPLKCTTRNLPAALSFDADLALQYAGLWLQRAGGVKVPNAGILRLALLRFAEHLAAADEAHEFTAIKRACDPILIPGPEAQQLALLRLYGADPEQPMPSFAVIQRGPNAARETAELTARAEVLAELAMKSRPMKRAPARNSARGTTCNPSHGTARNPMKGTS